MDNDTITVLSSELYPGEVKKLIAYLDAPEAVILQKIILGEIEAGRTATEVPLLPMPETENLRGGISAFRAILNLKENAVDAFVEWTAKQGNPAPEK